MTDTETQAVLDRVRAELDAQRPSRASIRGREAGEASVVLPYADLAHLVATVDALREDARRMRGPLIHIETLETGTLLGVLVPRDALVRPIVSGDIYEIRKVADWDAASTPTPEGR